MAVEHKIEVYNDSDQLLAEFDKWKGISYSEKLNQPSLFNFGLDISDDKATSTNVAAGRNYIKYYRDSTLKWSGQMVRLSGALAQNDRPFTVQCGDWLYILKDRYLTTEETWSSTDYGTILQECVDYTQAISDGDLGITNGYNGVTDTTDRTYFDKNIQEIFVEFASLSPGVDFEITPDRVLNVYAEKGNDLTATHQFQYGQNISMLDWDIDATQLKNDLKLYGADGRVRTADDSGSQGTYTRRQSIESFTDAYLDATLDKHGEELLQIHSTPIKTYKLNVISQYDPLFGTYALGDTVTLNITNNKFLNGTVTVRIYGWDVTVNEDGYEQVQLTVSTTL